MALVRLLMYSHDCFCDKIIQQEKWQEHCKNETLKRSSKKRINSLTQGHQVDSDASNQFLSGKSTHLKGIQPDCVCYSDYKITDEP